MKFVARDYQQLGINHLVNFLSTASPGDKKAYAAPTGTGKSVIELSGQLALNAVYNDCWIVTPKLEIVAGMLDKLGIAGAADMAENELMTAAVANKICTPIRLRNLMLSGAIDPPGRIIFDEGHHWLSESWQLISLLSGDCPATLLTATPYRGTPKGTADFLKVWGEPVWIITYPQAIERGVLSFPTIHVEPLIDDDRIEVSNGEFIVEQVTAATRSQFDYVCAIAARYCHNEKWDRPTMFTVGTRDLAHELAARLRGFGLPAVAITDKTSHVERQQIFAAVQWRGLALVQVNTISEGVDLPIRIGFDLALVCRPCCSSNGSAGSLARFRRAKTRRSTFARIETCCGMRICWRAAYRPRPWRKQPKTSAAWANARESASSGWKG
jgi:superfamily II DNA or RNA helicase